MAMNRAQFAKMLEPGLNTLFGLEYDSYPPEYSAVFSSNSSSKAFEEDVLLQGFGSAPTKDEGAAISYDTGSQQWTARYQHETVALAFSILRKLKRMVSMVRLHHAILKHSHAQWLLLKKSKLRMF